MIDWPQNKKEYRIFCKRNPEIPVFLQDWWLDIVCTKGKWDVCLAKNKNHEIIGVLPFYKRKYFGIQVIQMPALTPYCGVWMHYPKQLKKIVTKLSFEKKVMHKLIDQLPNSAYYAQRHPVQLTNWLPFYWKKFKQTTLYTYRIEYPFKLEETFSNMKYNTRYLIEGAQKKLNIIENNDIELFFKINQLTFSRQKKTAPYSLNFLKKLDNALLEKNNEKYC